MRMWYVFVLVTVVCWGTYVPMIHNGQLGFGTRNSALRAFLFVGLAYLVMAVTVLGWILATKAEPMQFTQRGVTLSTLAGVLGAVGALSVIFAIKSGGRPLVVAPVVFAGAPIVNTVVSLAWHRPAAAPNAWFFAGIVLAAAGASMVLYFKPA